MLITRFYRPRNFINWIKSSSPEVLPNSVMGIIKMVFWFSPHKFVYLLIGGILVQALALSIPYYTKHIIDIVSSGPVSDETINGVTHAFLIMLALNGVRVILQWLNWYVSYNWRPVLRKLNYTINRYIVGHTPHYFESELSGRIIQKASTLLTSTTYLIDAVLWNWVPALVYVFISFAMLYGINILLGVGTMVWFIALFLSANFLGKNVRRLARLYNDASSRTTGRFADCIINIRNTLLFSRRNHEDDGLASCENETIDRRRELHLSLYDMRLLNQLTHIVGLIAIVGGSIYLWAHNLATAGDIALASSIAIIALSRMNELAENMPDLFDAIGNMRDSLDTLVKPRDLTDVPNAPALQVSKGEITFNNVTFAYPGSPPVYSNFNVTIAAGERVGVVGVSGAGKSTLISIILRMYDVQSGTVSIDGQNIAHVTQESLRRNISFIPQDTLLFHRTIRENIAYGKLDATDDEVEAAARAAQAHEFIMQLPHGYSTMVGERGVKLSGGQRQRVAIARALLKNAPILILDEATSALDSEAESEIQAAIKTAMTGKTVIAIAHRLSTIASLDRLIVLHDGQIAEQGSHAELIGAGGIYAALWQHQSGGFLGVE